MTANFLATAAAVAIATAAAAAAPAMVPASTPAAAEAAPPVPSAPVPAPVAQLPIVQFRPRLPGFALALSQQAAIDGPRGWVLVARGESWAALATAAPVDRQSARWSYARSLIAQQRGPEAAGVLTTMLQDDPDLALVESFRLASGAAMVLGGHHAAAARMLDYQTLAANPEACAWRLRSFSAQGLADAALREAGCALPALNARTPGFRRPFLVAAAHAAMASRQPAAALQWLTVLPPTDPAANLYRGKAELALGRDRPGRLHLASAMTAGSPEQRVDAELSIIEADIARYPVPSPETVARLDHIRLAWRGGPQEQRALYVSLALGAATNDVRRSLAAGAALIRHFDLGAGTAPLLLRLQAILAGAMAPGAAMPVDQAAGLYWNYRDLAPVGAEGGFLVGQLADRLQGSGLYDRAADLLRFQLINRVRDIAQGPLSVRVATLYVLAGKPAQALDAIRQTEANQYPIEMLWDRHRIEAVALQKLGRQPEALAALQDVPDGPAIRAEIYWNQRNWNALALSVELALPETAPATDVEQAMVLRYAVALAMLGREFELSKLRARYASAFAVLPSAGAFDLLTGAIGTVDPEMISKAMAAIPSASPAGAIANLLDSTPAKKKA